MSIKFAVIGDPITHSLSPKMHLAMLEKLNLSLKYGKIHLEASDLDFWINSSDAKSLLGFNVTMPHKTKIMQYLSSISEEARDIGAVNTVVHREGNFYGYNTDSIGFIRSLKTIESEIEGKKVLILGKGGAAKAVAHGMLKNGAEVNVCSRSFYGAQFSENVKLYKWSEMQTILPEIDFLINATPLGMEGNELDFDSFEFLSILSKSAVVCDLIYKPEITNLIKNAQEKNLRTLGGLGMLIHQGIAALEYFLDMKLDINEMEEVVKNSLRSV